MVKDEEHEVVKRLERLLYEFTEKYHGKYFKIDKYVAREIFDYYCYNYNKKTKKEYDSILGRIMKIKDFRVDGDELLISVITPYDDMEFKLLLSEFVDSGGVFDTKEEVQVLLECEEN